jgi:hypothetical protein
MNRIIAKNLEMMLTKKEGYMLSLISSESMGGNAGSWKGYTCVGVNFSYNQDTGEIMHFENTPDIPSAFMKYPSHFFRVAIDFKDSRGYLILDYVNPRAASEDAKKNLEETVRQYNNMSKFKVKPRKK